MEEAFDTVLMKFGGEEELVFYRMLSEAARVLRPGGQLILGATCYPALANRIAGLFAEEMLEESHPFERSQVMEMLRSCEFENITWQRTGLTNGVMIAWKSKPGIDEMQNTAS